MVLYDGGKILVTMAAGSILGLVYVLVLPFAWIVAAIVILSKRVVHGLAGSTAKSTSFGWDPTEAYLTGKKKADKEKSDKKKS